MFRSLLWRPRWPIAPIAAYLLLRGGSAGLFSLMFTLNLVYQATVVGLSPLQLVLVGTLLEVVSFLFEVPTGIVADLYSRRLSVIIGCALIGAGFTLEGSIPTFAAVLACQVLWGIGYTFTSGASEAWVTDEVGEAQMAPVFLRGTQVALVATIAGIVLSGALGLVSVQLPVLLGGIGFMILAVVLLLVMPERNFHRTPAGERSTFSHMAGTFRDGFGLARRRVVVRSLLLITFVIGLASEAFDRLWTVHILDNHRFPALFGGGSDSPALWFAIIALAGTVISLVVSELVKRVSPRAIDQLHPNRLLAFLSGLQVLGLVFFVLAGSLWMALGSLWFKSAAQTISGPVEAAWINRHLESRLRATVLSMQGQGNAIGQVIGGPVLGGVGSGLGVRAALIASALVLSPVVWLYGRIGEETAATDDHPHVRSATGSASSSAPGSAVR
ncbi:MAG TPA: MFS transporter [Thermomicrobiales bacterium]|nr:MFS transporter [Thermomicrobiales bacterium]